VLWAQLHLALCSVWFMSGDAGRAVAEADAVLASPGLPGRVYAAAAQSRLLALIAQDDPRVNADQIIPSDGEAGTPAALTTLAALAWRGGRVGDTVRWLREAADADRTTCRSGPRCYPELGLAVVLAAMGGFEEANALVVAAADEITLRGDTQWAAAPAVFAARIDLAAGRRAEATTLAHVGLDLSADLATPLFAPIARQVLVTAALSRLELEAAGEELARWPADDVIARLPFGGPNRLWMAARLREASAKVVDAATSDNAFDVLATDLPLLLEESAAAAWLVRAAFAVGDKERASAVVDTAAHLAALNPNYPAVAALASHARGVFAGDPELLVGAASGYRSPWARASAAEDAGVAFRERGERAEATKWLVRAAAEYERCDATRDHGRVRARLRKLGVRRRHWRSEDRPATGWDSLTETELAVTDLVTEGLSNQQVGQRMFLSRHTVDFHLRQIFRKLGIDSRVVLTRMALTHEEVGA
jgi:DNA-binding CsgD family transcriptional regulator